MTRVRRIGVVVPAHDEAEFIQTCLQALGRAAATVAVPVHALVVQDNCTDATHRVVAAADPRAFASLRSISVSGRNVGAARHAGFAEVLTELPIAGSWLATTDADSAVPSDWFTRQLHHAANGSEVIAGTVRVQDWSEHPDGVRERYLQRYVNADGHRHVHGANLSFTAAAYVRAGGFAALVTGEDVDLLDRMTAQGRRTLWAADLAVTTSARRHGRAPAGFAAHLVATQQEAKAG